MPVVRDRDLHYWLDARRSAPVTDNARGRDFDFGRQNKRPAADFSKEALLQNHRPFDIRWSLSVVPQSLRCFGGGNRKARHVVRWHRRVLGFIGAGRRDASWRQAFHENAIRRLIRRDEHCQSAVGGTADPWRTARARHRNIGQTEAWQDPPGEEARQRLEGWKTSFVIMPTASRRRTCSCPTISFVCCYCSFIRYGAPPATCFNWFEVSLTSHRGVGHKSDPAEALRLGTSSLLFDSDVRPE